MGGREKNQVKSPAAGRDFSPVVDLLTSSGAGHDSYH